MLLEKDKRKRQYAVPLMYQKPDEPDFFRSQQPLRYRDDESR